MDERLPIWKKDDYFPAPEGRIDMDPAVVDIDEDKKYLLSWMYNWDVRSIVGTVSNVRLEDGEILGDIEIKDKLRYERVDDVLTGILDESYPKELEKMLRNEEVRLGGFYTGVQLNEDKTQVLSCNLETVAVILMPIYPIPPISKED